MLSTNFFNPACTAGRENNSQKMSISRRNSSIGIGLMNRLAATAVCRSNFPICAAVALAARNASPSPTTWLTSPICCALVALKLRPVSSKSRTTALPKSRFSRGIPPNPGISPSRSSGKQNRAILSAMIKSQTSASSNPPPNVTP